MSPLPPDRLPATLPREQVRATTMSQPGRGPEAVAEIRAIVALSSRQVEEVK